MYDLIIIGCGPAGLAVAVEAKKNGLNALVIEKGAIVNSIVNFPTDMIFFSTSDLLEIDRIPFTSNRIRPTRREAVLYYQKVLDYYQITVKTHERFVKLEQNDSSYTVYTQPVNAAESESINKYQGTVVVLAGGVYDNPRKLNIAGENLPHVSHHYSEPFSYYQREVVIVGGSNSAVETSLDIHRHGGKVTVLHRGAEINKGVKYWILPDFQNRVKEGSINLILNAQIKRILSKTVEYAINDKVFSISCDHVLLMIGYESDARLYEICQIDYDPQSLVPVYDPDTLESSRKGLYLAGTIIAGKYSNKIFIENSRAHAQPIVRDILSRLR